METLVRSVGQILEERTQFAVPVFQRHYVWAEKSQLAPLWDDILDNVEDALQDKPRRYPHYLGALIFTIGAAPIGRVPVKQVIDGQQRLTTTQVLLFAIAEIARQRDLPTIRATALSYVTNDRESLMIDPATERHKVLPTAYDRSVYSDISMLSESDLTSKYSSFYWGGKLVQNRTPKLLLAYFFFIESIKTFLKSKEYDEADAEARLSAILDIVLKRFSVVAIALSDEDDAQTIFSTLNARGEPLNATDLIRNDIFHRALRTRESADTLFADHWGEFEKPFWEQPERQGRVLKPRLEFFFANFLVTQLRREVNLSKIYPEYRAYASERKFQTVREELLQLANYSAPYKQLLERMVSGPLSDFGAAMTAWDNSTAFPAAMLIDVEAPASEVEPMLSLITSFIVRRAVCSMDAKNNTKNFVALIDALWAQGPSLQTMAAFFRSQTAESSRFPTDSEFASALITKQVYGSGWDRRTRWMLEELESVSKDRFDEPISIDGELTIEHVMPNRWASCWPLSSGGTAPTDLMWELGLHPDLAIEVRKEIEERCRLVDTIGNLVLVTQPKNSRLSNRSFYSKRDELADSALKLTRTVGVKSEWTEDSIQARSQVLASLALKVWTGVH